MTAPIPLLGQDQTLFDRVGEDRLRRLLWTFYGRVMTDDLLGPVFQARVGPYPGGGWPVHIARLEGFWRAVMHGPSAYRGQPGPAHMKLGIGPEHFDRWLAFWQGTLPDILEPPEAEEMYALASRMRPNLERFALAPTE